MQMAMLTIDNPLVIRLVFLFLSKLKIFLPNMIKSKNGSKNNKVTQMLSNTIFSIALKNSPNTWPVPSLML